MNQTFLLMNLKNQAADLTVNLVVVIKRCGEEQILSNIVEALAAVANTVGMTQMNPPVKDLLSRSSPILRNRHEKVQ
ncbi:hypothetical protein C8R43DRAFT_68217 [Mycena crocata]|nr:hypothetical protein C8R43DRAFT_68217 [Mycena crocata]